MNAGGRIRALLAGLLAGIAGGLFGVGGGIILIPLLTGWFKTTQHQAHGTSLAAIGATAVASIIVYGIHSHVEAAGEFATGSLLSGGGPGSDLAGAAGVACPFLSGSRSAASGSSKVNRLPCFPAEIGCGAVKNSF